MGAEGRCPSLMPPVRPHSSRKPVSPGEISESLWTQDPDWPTEGCLLPYIAGHHPDVIFLGGTQAGRSCWIWARGRVLGGADS